MTDKILVDKAVLQQVLDLLVYMESEDVVRDFLEGHEFVLINSVIYELLEELAQPQQVQASIYGYCPTCGEKGVSRERSLNGHDVCVNGHKYLSSKALKHSV